ncbi:MAG: NUDIX hydrolase [Acidimicrobiales bacterium]
MTMPDVRRPEVCVGGVAVSGNDLLMVRRGHGPGAGEWSLPGGRVEWGETAAEAVVREVAEETGIDVLCGPMIDWVERISDDHHFMILDFEVVLVDRHAMPEAGDDAAEARWVPVWEVPELRLVEGLADFLADHDIIETVV